MGRCASLVVWVAALCCGARATDERPASGAEGMELLEGRVVSLPAVSGARVSIHGRGSDGTADLRLCLGDGVLGPDGRFAIPLRSNGSPPGWRPRFGYVVSIAGDGFQASRDVDGFPCELQFVWRAVTLRTEPGALVQVRSDENNVWRTADEHGRARFLVTAPWVSFGLAKDGFASRLGTTYAPASLKLPLRPLKPEDAVTVSVTDAQDGPVPASVHCYPCTDDGEITFAGLVMVTTDDAGCVTVHAASSQSLCLEAVADGYSFSERAVVRSGGPLRLVLGPPVPRRVSFRSRATPGTR